MPHQHVLYHLAFLKYVLYMVYVEESDLTGFYQRCYPSPCNGRDKDI